MYNENIFTNVSKYVENGKGKVSYTGILIASKLNQKNGQDYKLVDAVDIDWNGAWIDSMGSTYLYTTEHLIEVLNTLNKSNELGAIQREIEKIWEQINQITATYVTYSYLEEHLTTYWQKKLSFGDFVGYDEDTQTVYSYGLPTYEYLKESYTTKIQYDELITYIGLNYYNKPETETVAYEAAFDAIVRVIAGADQKFDTLKEVADWILDQNVWVEVDLSEILEALETYKETGEWPKDTYFTYDEETETHTPVNDPDEIDTSGNTIYWKQENYLVELKRLIVRVNALDERVGDKYYNEEYDFYTYTGLFQEVDDLKAEDKKLHNELGILNIKIDKVEELSNRAYDLGYTAYNTAYTAYGIAYTALEQSWQSIAKANLAYDMAYTAIIKVGDETVEAGFIEILEENLQEIIELGYTIWYKDEDGNFYTASEPYDEEIQYYYYQEYKEGTGLTRRVEKVEVKAEEALTTANVALISSYESLYYLSVDNEESAYVKLGLHPDSFNNNDRNRIISITTSEATIDKHSGEIFGEGLINIQTAFDIYSYASSWMMLYVDDDVEFPNQDLTPEPTEDPDEPDIL